MRKTFAPACLCALVLTALPAPGGEGAAPPGPSSASAPATLPAGVEIRIGAERLQLLSGGAPFLEYRHGGPNLFKPCIPALWTGGARLQPLRDAPFDHLHHHALMLAFNVDGVEFWGVEDANCGRQVHLGFAAVEEPRADGRAAFTERLAWRAPAPAGKEGKVLLLEERRLAARPARAGGPLVVDWTSVLRAPPGSGKATLTGREYHGLGVRFVIPMDKGGRFQNADGGAGVAGTNQKRSRWCAYSAAPEPGATVTFALFDDPKDPRSPADWFTMDSGFAYMTLTMGLDAEPLVLEEGREMRLHYGVGLFDGEAPAGVIEAAWKAWLDDR